MRKAKWVRPLVGMLFEQNFEDFRAKGTLALFCSLILFVFKNSTSKCIALFYVSVFPDVYSASQILSRDVYISQDRSDGKFLFVALKDTRSV